MRPIHWIYIFFLLFFISIGVINDNYYLIIISSFVGFSLLLFEIFNIRNNFFIKSSNEIPKGKMNIILTFDDGPTDNSIELLNTLNKHEVKAIFFVIGNKLKGNEDIINKIDKNGHIIGNHSWSHGKLYDFGSTNYIYNDIQQANEMIKRITGKIPQYYRPPYGVINPPISKAIKKTNMKIIGWSYRSFDTIFGSRKFMYFRTINSVKDGDILLFHETTNGITEFVDKIIPKLKSKGFNFIIIK
jgi:peptidoglycan/xylan/chitin deacetylase (PgdA/CDA1 family)